MASEPVEMLASSDSELEDDEQDDEEVPVPTVSPQLAVNKYPTNPVFEAFVRGDPNRLLVAVRTCTPQHLMEASTSLAAAISMTPFYFHHITQKLLDALKTRATWCPQVAQRLLCLARSRSLSDDIASVILSWPFLDASTVFNGFSDKAENRAGMSLPISADVPFYHPFVAVPSQGTIASLDVLSVFSTNAKPLLIACRERRADSAASNHSPHSTGAAAMSAAAAPLSPGKSLDCVGDDSAGSEGTSPAASPALAPSLPQSAPLSSTLSLSSAQLPASSSCETSHTLLPTLTHSSASATDISPVPEAVPIEGLAHSGGASPLENRTHSPATASSPLLSSSSSSSASVSAAVIVGSDGHIVAHAPLTPAVLRRRTEEDREQIQQQTEQLRTRLRWPVIFKSGADMRQDAAILQVFRFLNTLWADAKLDCLGFPCCAQVYNVCALTDDSGVIECLPQCHSLKFINQVYLHMNSESLDRLAANCAGAYIASFVLGVRDRHFDNIMVRSDGLFFHIDFSYALGNKVAMDAAVIAVTPDLYEVLKPRWKAVVNTAVRAFAVIRNNQQLFSSFVRMVWSVLPSAPDVEAFLAKSLLCHMNLADACKKVKRKLEKAPFRTKTKFKNAMHHLATL